MNKIIDKKFKNIDDDKFTIKKNNDSKVKIINKNIDLDSINAGFPPLRLKNKNISDKNKFFQPKLNIRDILTVNEKKKDFNIYNVELEIINSL